MNYGFDSQEEKWFSHWLSEALAEGMVDRYVYHPSEIVLSETKIQKVVSEYYTKVRKYKRTRTTDRLILRECTYTPDFIVFFTESFRDVYPKLLIEFGEKDVPENVSCYIDVKGTFAGRNNTSAVTFPIKQKWIYDKYEIFINKVVPEKFFNKTWVPKYVRLTSRGKVSKKWNGYPILAGHRVTDPLFSDFIREV